MNNRRFRIIWLTESVGPEETIWIGNSLRDARRAARKMVGQTFDLVGGDAETVIQAFVANEDR